MLKQFVGTGLDCYYTNQTDYDERILPILKPLVGEGKHYLSDYEEKLVSIWNNPERMIFEAEYILKGDYFSTAVEKLADKDWTGNTWYYDEYYGTYSSFISKGVISESFNTFKGCLYDNNLKTNGIDEKVLRIPPIVFKRLAQLSYIPEEIEMLEYMADLFALMALAKKTEFIKGEKNALTFKFHVLNKVIEIEWRDWKTLSGFKYFNVYQDLLNS